MSSKATALLLNWKRPDNLEKIINRLRQQSVPVDIFLWDNNPTRQFDVDLHIRSDHNLMCWPRWFMANYANTEFVFSLDDDLIPNNNSLIEYCIETCEKYDSIIGCRGLCLGGGKLRKLAEPSPTRKCDCLLGRFIFANKKHLADVKMYPWDESTIRFPRIEDDIVIGSYASSLFHIGDLHKFFDDVQGQGEKVGLCAQPGHLESRNKFTKAFFNSEYKLC